MADPQSYADAMKRLAGSGRRLGGHNFPGAVRHDGSLIMTENMWIEIANTESKNARSMALPRGRGIDTIFVIDISKSMQGKPFEKAINFILTFLDIIENINRQHRLHENVALVTVGHKTEVLQHLTSDYGMLRNKLASIQVDGRTPMMAGLFMALSAINGRGSITVMNGTKVHPRIVLLTDAKFTDSESITGLDSSMYDQQEIDEEVFHLAARLATEHHSIHCVNVGDVKIPDILVKIAQVTDGSVIGCDEGSVKKLGRHFKNMAAVTRMRRNFALNTKNRDDFETIVKSYESDVEQTDIDDMMAILQYKLTDSVEEDTEFLDGSAPALGTRVARGPQWSNGMEDGSGPGTIVLHSRKHGYVTVEWDLTRVRGEYSYQEGKKQLVISHVQRILMDDDLIAPGCLVCRGDDWNWGFQDGGPENVGVVYDVQPSGLVHVRWPNGHCNWYRFGAEGMFDVRIWEPPSSNYEHGAQSQPINLDQTVLPPPTRKSQIVTSATSLQNEPSHTTPEKDVTETVYSRVSEMPVTDGPGPEPVRKHVLPPNTTPVQQVPDASMWGPQTNQARSDGPKSLSDQSDLSIDHASLVGNRTSTEDVFSDTFAKSKPDSMSDMVTRSEPTSGVTSYTTPGVTSDTTPGMTSGTTPGVTSGITPGVTSGTTSGVTSDTTPRVTSDPMPGVTSDAKEDVVYTQEDVEWCWHDKRRNQWVAFSEANTKILEEEKKKNRKKSCKNIKIIDKWYRVYLSTMKLQMVNSRESTSVKRAMIPRPIIGMRKGQVDKYMKLLDKGSYPSSNIRLMVVGNDRVGKTSLCRNMLKDKKFGNTDGTDGIDVFVNSYQINTKTKKKTKLGETEHVIAMQKLACATAFGKSKTEVEGEEDMPELEEEQPEMEETDSVPHFPQKVSIKQPVPPPVTPTPAPTTELENSIEQININQPIIFSETTMPIKSHQRSNYVVGKHTGEISIPDYVKRDVDYILDEAKKLETVKGTEQEDIAYLSMWDFGGEKIFYDSHHIFLSKDAVYLLCFDVQKIQKDGDFEPILFWLRSIATYSECTGKSKGPPVILIGTHTDQLDGDEENKEMKFQEICARITSHADVEPIKSQILDYFCVDNMKENDKKFDVILDAVIKAAEYQSQWKMDVPTKWLALEREIMKVKKDKVKTFEQIVQMDKKMEAPIGDQEEIRMFLRYLHLMGYIMYFDEDVGVDSPHRFKDLKIIIDPQWVIYAFRRLITNPKNIEGRGSKRMVMWTNYVTDGQLTTPFIDELWGEGKEETDKENFLPYKDILLTVMERLGLLAPPVANKSRGDCPENLDFYIVPSMLSDVDQTWVDNLLKSSCLQKTATLRLTLQKQFISLPVFHKLLAACLSRFKIDTYLDLPDDVPQKNGIKKGFGCFGVTAAWKMILSYDNSAINVTLFTYSEDDSCIRAGVGLTVRIFLEKTIIDVLRLQGQNTKNLTCEYFLGFDILRENRKVRFARKDEIVNLAETESVIQADGRYLRKVDLKPWFCSEEEMDTPIPVAYFLPPHQQNLIPSDVHLSRISNCMCLREQDKRSFGLELGLENHHITTILNDHDGTVNHVYHILAKWKQLHSKGKISNIIKAMKKVRLDCKFFYKRGKVFD